MMNAMNNICSSSSDMYSVSKLAFAAVTLSEIYPDVVDAVDIDVDVSWLAFDMPVILIVVVVVSSRGLAIIAFVLYLLKWSVLVASYISSSKALKARILSTSFLSPSQVEQTQFKLINCVKWV